MCGGFFFFSNLTVKATVEVRSTPLEVLYKLVTISHKKGYSPETPDVQLKGRLQLQKL